jgi:hypothetical protein
MEPKDSLLHSQEHTIARPYVTFHNMLIFYGEESLALCITSKLEDHSFVGCSQLLIQYICSYLHIWRLSPPLTTLAYAMPLFYSIW